MAGILAEPKVPRLPALGARLARLSGPLARFFETVPEIKACAFTIISPAAPSGVRRESPVGATWSTYFSWDEEEMSQLQDEDRFPASAWRLENAPESLSIAAYCLIEFPSSAYNVSGLLALRDGLYWVHDIALLSLHVGAIAAYPKNPIVPVFPNEPTAHALIATEPAFRETFPRVANTIERTWGTGFQS